MKGEWLPVDSKPDGTPHGGRLGLNGRNFRQRAAPWRPEGCKYGADRSFAWNARLVRRRDKGRCVSCGAKGEEVQHIIPRSILAKNFGVTRDGPSWLWRNLGNCPHNLVLLCRPCHDRTKRAKMNRFAGVPNGPAFVPEGQRRLA